jgi:lysophospholipid acyltransferase (LPLAT)-like uncharacterized protein
VRTFLGAYVIGGYLRFGAATSTIVYDPPDLRQRLAALEPALFVSWHGHVPRGDQTDLLASHHPDGRMAAAYAKSMGWGVIDGAGRTAKHDADPGGFAAFRGMMRSLKAGRSIYVNGDVPPIPGRELSRGLIMLARRTGRPLVPVATSGSRRTILERSWDKMQITHPFGRLAIVAGAPYYVGDDIGDDAAAAEFKQRLDATLEHSLAVADAP